MGKIKNIFTDSTIELALDENGRIDIDYVFENLDGNILNIQFDNDGLEYNAIFENEIEFLKTMDSRLKNYKDFYNPMVGNENYKYVGFADGHCF